MSHFWSPCALKKFSNSPQPRPSNGSPANPPPARRLPSFLLNTFLHDMKPSLPPPHFHKCLQPAGRLAMQGQIAGVLALTAFLAIPALAVNPPPPIIEPGKTYGEYQQTNDEEEEPSDEGKDCDGTEGQYDSY